MCEFDDDGYDGFEKMLNEIARFKDLYYSFTTGKVYTDLLGETASGLLRDAAAETAKLPLSQRKHHEYSKNIFAAFCIYFCLTEIRTHFKNIDLSRAQDVAITVYGKILKHVRRELETEGECHFLRRIIRIAADHAMLDEFKKNNRYVTLDDGPEETSNDECEKIPAKVLAELIEGIDNTRRKMERLYALERVIAAVAREKVLTERELLAVCHFYGYGTGFEKLSNGEIARLLKCSEGEATKVRTKALRKIRDFIRKTPEFREEFD